MSRRARTGAVLVAGTLGVGAAIAIAAVPDGGGVFHACYTSAVGAGTIPASTGPNIRLIDPSAGQQCDPASNEHAFTFNQQGQPGPQGEPGPAGAEGTLPVPPPETNSGQVTVNGGSRARSLPISGASTFPFLTVGLDVTGPGSRSSGYGTARVPAPGVIVTRTNDEFSPKLMLACASGEHFKKVVFQLFKSGTTTAYLTYTLTNAVITSVQTSGHGDTIPTETVQFAEEKLTTEYAPGATHTLPAIQYSSSAKTKLRFPR
jgi:type VI secretion system Hcp family effector